MPRRAATTLSAAFLAVLPVGQLAAVPLPPPVPSEVQRAMEIVVPPRGGRLSHYVNLFAGRVIVLENGKKVASTRAEFLTYLKARTGSDIAVRDLSVGNPILVAESVADFPKPRIGAVYECCFYARIASYHFASNGKVDRVSFVGNGLGWAADPGKLPDLLRSVAPPKTPDP